MPDDALRKLRSFRDALDSQDAILLEAARADKGYLVPILAARPIKDIFNDILAEFPGLTQKFEYHGSPSALRAQIAGSRGKLQNRIDQLKQEAAEDAARHELRFDVRASQQLLDARISESKIPLPINASQDQILEAVLPWVDRTLQTLGKLFPSPWNTRKFEERLGLADITTLSAPALLGHFDGAVEFLRMLREDLYLAQHAASSSTPTHRLGEKIFIGHGRSLIWLELKEFVEKRLKLMADEFNREPTAGLYTGERINTMLDDARFALLVMTAEDEQPDGRLRARENVVHEAGLFQGRLGFKRAIVLLEEQCETFSNIDGLTVIKFPKGRISGVFEETRRTLEREGVIPKK